MGYNKKILSQATAGLNKAKAPAKKKDRVINPIPLISNEGFKQGPPPEGTNYRIPSNTIYNPTPYNILAKASTGEERIISAGDTTPQIFNNATHVDEFQLKKGGQKNSTKKYSRSITATNRLFDKNPLFKKPKSKKKKIFDPNAKYYQDGGIPENYDAAVSENNTAFLNSMMNSPLFVERYARMVGKPIEEVGEEAEAYRQQMIQNLQTVGMGDSSKPPISYESLGAAAFYQPPFLHEKAMNDLPKKGKVNEQIRQAYQTMQDQSHKLYFGQDQWTQPTDLHERSHASTLGELKMNKGFEYRDMSNPRTNSFWDNFEFENYVKNYPKSAELPKHGEDYFTQPTELKARKDVAAKKLQELGLYDPVNENFTEDHYNKLLKLMNDVKIDSDTRKQIRDIVVPFNKEDTIRMFNDMVQNDQKSMEQYAKRGGVTFQDDSGFTETELTPEQIDEYRKGGWVVEELPQAQEGLQQPVRDKAEDEIETFAFATPAAEKKHKQLMDKTRALMTTVRGREAWYQNVKPKDFTNKELSRFIQGAEDYRKQAEEFERARRKVKEDKISTTDFARMYEERDWARFDPNVMREGYKGQYQNAVDEANARKAKNMGVTDAVLEATGAPALKRVVEDPLGTLKAVGQTAADAGALAAPGIGSIMGAGDPSINPLTGQPYWGGLNKSLDLLSVLPFAGYLGATDDLARASKYLTKRPLKNVPKQLPGSGTFKSEIDWGKWNPETPTHKVLMDEYNAIEESTKKAGTWMKNPDGSTFQGTPEQFIQQQSSYFKKAFGDSKLVNPDGSPWILEHGSPKKFDTFDESKFQLGDSGYSGSGIYTVPPKGSASSYTFSGSRFHTGVIEPTLYKLYGLGKNPITSEELIKMGTNSPAGKEMDLFNFHRKSAPLNEQLLDYDVAIHNQNRGIARVRDLDDAWEVVFPTNKQLKSATGNVGFFDMNDPNIYRTTDFEDAGFLVPEKSYFTPQTDFEKELANQAEEYFRLKTSPENFERARALDAEFGTQYTQGLQDLITQKTNQGVAQKYPFNIRVENNPGEGTGAYSSLTEAGAIKKEEGIPTTIDDREIVIYGNSPIKDIRRRTQHEMSHHTILGRNNDAAFKNEWGEKLKNALDNPGEISKTNPALADKLMQKAFPKSNNPKTLFEYVSDPAEVDAYLNTTLRDDLVQKGILKNHWDILDENKLALYFMHEGSKDNIVDTLLDIVKPSEFLEIFNKGVYVVPAAVTLGAASQSEYRDGGIVIDLDDESQIQNYIDQGYIVEFDEGGFVPSVSPKFVTNTPKELPKKQQPVKPVFTGDFANKDVKFISSSQSKGITPYAENLLRSREEVPIEELQKRYSKSLPVKSSEEEFAFPGMKNLQKYANAPRVGSNAPTQPIQGGMGSLISNTGKAGIVDQKKLTNTEKEIAKLNKKTEKLKEVVQPTFLEKVNRSQAQAFQGPDVYKAKEDLDNLLQQGQNYLSRQNLKNSNAKEPTVKPLFENKETNKLPSVITGDPIYLNKRRYYTQEVVDLNSVKLGYRNRNEYRDINTEAGNVTAFNPFLPKNKMNLSKIKSSETFIGIDKNGKFKTGTIDKFNSDDLISKTFSNVIVDFVYNPDGTVKLEKRNKDNPNNPVPVVKVIENGKEKIGSLNFLTKSGVANPYEQFGEIQGGRIILKSGNKTLLVSGSINDVVSQFKKLKEQTNKPVEVITLDNGSYNLGIRTKDKKITSQDLEEYDNLNNSGGNFLYLLSESAPSKSNQGFKPKSINDASKVKVQKDIPDFSNLIDSPTARYFKNEVIDKKYTYGMSTDPLLIAKKASGKGLPGEKEIDCSGAICKVLTKKGVNVGDPTANNSAQHFHDRSKQVKWADIKDGDIITMKTSGGKVDHIGFIVIDKKTGKKFIAESSRSFNEGRIVPFKQRIDFLKELYPDFVYSVRRM